VGPPRDGARMIGLVIAGVASGVGKTTLTLGLIGALRRRGLTVQPFKVGPDYIDPSQHAQVAGRPSRNLDSWMVPEAALRELFVRAARTADVALVEGVMGLFDGRSGAGEVGSTAHVAKLLGLPVLLVIDAAKAGRSMAVAALGCRMADPALRIVGVVLNNVASERHATIGREAIESLAELPVLGCIMRDGELRQEERYLGLIPGAERQVSPTLVERAMASVESGVDLAALTRLTTISVPDVQSSGLFPEAPRSSSARIAVAQDEAFSFYYQDSLDLLAAWGAELVPFSPLRDQRLPERVGGVYLGGGFPELFAIDLAVNGSMLASIREAAGRGLPIYAECGGLMYLQEALIDADGRRHRMAGLVPGTSALIGKRLTLGYREAVARRDSPLAVAGQTVRGHEFHWSVCDSPTPETAAYELADGSGRLEGFAAGNVVASYIHVHLASDQHLAPRFVAACLKSLTPRPALPCAGEGEPAGHRSRHDVVDAACGLALSRARERMSAKPIFAPRSGAGGEGSFPGPLLRHHGLPPAEIEALSRRRIEAQVADRLPTREPERGLAARLVYAAGDPDLCERIVVQGGAIQAAIAALASGADLVVDVGMVAAGLAHGDLAKLGVPLHVAIKAPGIVDLAAAHGVTRSAAGIMALADRLDGAVVAIGNAPTALLALLDLVAQTDAKPAAVIGMPVGFVAAEESKELLLTSGLPCVAVRGTRGGSALAAAAVNHLLRLARESSDRASR
jgi:cobyrinic acid a,c-diamide synthase